MIHGGPELPAAALRTDMRPVAGHGQIPPSADTPPLATDPAQFVHAVRRMTLDDIERLVIEHAIADSGGSLTVAARGLGVSPSTLYRKRERWVGAG
jgi:two-component system, repressor protein LuxO